jgi:hypothetical protein
MKNELKLIKMTLDTKKAVEILNEVFCFFIGTEKEEDKEIIKKLLPVITALKEFKQ